MASSRSGWAPSIYSLGLAVLVLAPLFGPGYLLLRDAVSTPRSYFTDSAFGIADAAARAVPQDALIAGLSVVFDGGLVVKVILLLALWTAGWGAAVMTRTLLPTAPLPALLVASTVAIWNPYVAERLLQGHWSLLVGYAALPWTVVAGLRLRAGRGMSQDARRPRLPQRPRGNRAPNSGAQAWGAMALCLAAAALTPTGALLASVTALVVVGAPGGRRRGVRTIVTLVTAAAASAPWLTATALSGGGASTDPAGWAAFAARAEPGLGTIGSLAGLGGIWNSDAVPGSRTSIFALAYPVVLLIVVALGVRPLLRRRRNPVIVALGVVAILAVTVPALAATPIGLDAARWVGAAVPGAGLLRDAQKWVALAMPFYALATAAGIGSLLPRAVAHRPARTRTLRPHSRRPTWTKTHGGVVILALLLTLPDLAWGVRGALKPVDYPESWSAVASTMQGGTGDVAVLPAGMFRVFPYSGDAPVLDPAPRMLPLDVLQTGELIVAGGTVEGEGTRASVVESSLLAGESEQSIRELGVGWILVEHTTPGPLGDSQRTLDQLTLVYADEELSLYRIDDPSDIADSSRLPVVVAHLLWIALLLGGAAVALGSRILRSHEA